MKKQTRLVKMQGFIILLACLSIVGIYFHERPAPEIEIIAKAKIIKTKESEIQVSNPIDFDAYWKINKDVYAYLYIHDTVIDYPILQHASDNGYYLFTTIDGVSGYPGSIYSEKETAKDFSDPNTILYGHNMSATYGTMFYDVTRYKDPTYFNAHKNIYIYTPKYIYQYQVFASYTFDNRHLLYAFDFKNREVYQEYLNMIQQLDDANIDEHQSVGADDRILTLSTCTDDGSARYLVQAVLKETIPCSYKNSVITTKTMKDMKEAQVVTNKDKITKIPAKTKEKNRFISDLKAFIPYFGCIVLLLACFVYLQVKQRRSVENQPTSTNNLKGFKQKIKFMKFLITQSLCAVYWKKVKEYVRFLKFLLSQLIREGFQYMKRKRK